MCSTKRLDLKDSSKSAAQAEAITICCHAGHAGHAGHASSTVNLGNLDHWSMTVLLLVLSFVVDVQDHYRIYRRFDNYDSMIFTRHRTKPAWNCSFSDDWFQSEYASRFFVIRRVSGMASLHIMMAGSHTVVDSKLGWPSVKSSHLWIIMGLQSWQLVKAQFLKHNNAPRIGFKRFVGWLHKASLRLELNGMRCSLEATRRLWPNHWRWWSSWCFVSLLGRLQCVFVFVAWLGNRSTWWMYA